jgi:hypothetical protein
MTSLRISWQRLVKDGETCTRCGDTGRELEAAVAKLAMVLRPLGIEPVLETQEIDEAAFRTDTSESNRVWIAGKPIEDWLGASAGTSRCCSVCGDADCRTLEIDGRTYETIPEEQFIKAGLMAASQMFAPALDGRTTSCCGGRAGTGPAPLTSSPVGGDCCGGAATASETRARAGSCC